MVASVLYQSVLNDRSWHEDLSPLGEGVHWSIHPISLVSITLAMLSLLNVVAGIHIETAVAAVERESRAYAKSGVAARSL